MKYFKNDATCHLVSVSATNYQGIALELNVPRQYSPMFRRGPRLKGLLKLSSCCIYVIVRQEKYYQVVSPFNIRYVWNESRQQMSIARTITSTKMMAIA